MASYKAIAAVGQAIVKLLRDASRAEFPEATFDLFQASDFGATGRAHPSTGATVYLYRACVSTGRRNLPPRQDASGKRFRPPVPLDLFFLITPWASDSNMQSILLGWVIRVLEDTPILPAALLNELEENGNIFSAGETVELFLDPLPLADMSVLWENLKQAKALPSVTYVARMVLVNSFIELPTGEPVQTREFRFLENA